MGMSVFRMRSPSLPKSPTIDDGHKQRSCHRSRSSETSCPFDKGAKEEGDQDSLNAAVSGDVEHAAANGQDSTALLKQVQEDYRAI